MSSERTIEIAPDASALISSLRGLGYSPETALADLIDNSITAKALAVEIDLQWNDGTPVVAVLDSGNGMDQAHLAQAMRLGGNGPDSPRDAEDLGRPRAQRERENWSGTTRARPTPAMPARRSSCRRPRRAITCPPATERALASAGRRAIRHGRRARRGATPPTA